MDEEWVILVDEQDRELGRMEKLQAHREGKLHRAISVFIYNRQGELLLQQRASDKYHSAGLWSNTCCSHPRPGENTLAAAERRLKEEMGWHCKLEHRYEFIYKASLDQDLVEHEYDHVFVGINDARPQLNSAEVMAYRWISPETLLQELQEEPGKFTYWFRALAGKSELLK